MHKDLEKLIDFALADGVLTEREKQVLYKKATELDVDLNELEMVVEAKLHLRQSEKYKIMPPSTYPKAKSEKYGDVKKCPSCGSELNSYSTSCKDCGYEFRNIGANYSLQKLSDSLNNAKYESDKESLINNFPIPNTKEDILELLFFIYPKTKIRINSDEITAAWRNKFIELLDRAKIAFAKDEILMSKIQQYEKGIHSRFNRLTLFILILLNGLDTEEKRTLLLFIILVFGFLIFGFLINGGYIPK